MRVAVSGASGYLGTHLISLFLTQGNDVLGIVRNMNASLLDLQGKYAEHFSICGSVFDDMFHAMRQFSPDVVYSTTCCYETDISFLERVIDSNYVFPSQLIKATIQNCNIDRKAVRFINIGTSLPSSFNLYSLTKNSFSELGKFYASQNRVQFVNVLLENFYGADEPETRFINQSIRKLLKEEDLDITEGRQKRDYVAISDVLNVLSFLGTTENINMDSTSVPLGSGADPSIREIIEFLKTTVNSKSTINFGAKPSRHNEPSTRADLTKLRELGYYKEMIYWKDGMTRMVEEIKQLCI